MPIDKGAATQGELGTNCTICLEGGCDAKLEDCGHLFHWTCLEGLMQSPPPTNSLCPNCRTRIRSWLNLRGGHWWDDSY